MTKSEGGKPHRWTKDTAPRPGGKPGRVSVRVAAVKEKVTLTLDEMLGQAHTNVLKALKKGDIRTSMWLVDTLRKERGSTLEAGVLSPLVGALETLDDVAHVSHQALLLAIKGDMTFDQLKCVQEALARHSVLKGVIELRTLRNEVEDMVRAAEAKPVGFSRDHIPKWGRLAKADPQDPPIDVAAE